MVLTQAEDKLYAIGLDASLVELDLEETSTPILNSTPIEISKTFGRLDKDPIYTMCLAETRHQIFTGGENGKLKIVSINSQVAADFGQILYKSDVSIIQIDSAQETLYIGHKNGSIYSWNIKNNAINTNFGYIHRDTVSSMVLLENSAVNIYLL
jgi:hypothetical protein